MWLNIFVPIVSAAVGAVIGALATAYFSSRSISVKLAEIDTKIFKIAEIVVERHNKEFHRDSMYTYVEGEIYKHKSICGNDLETTLKRFDVKVDKMEAKLHHMEIKQSKINIKLNIINQIISEMAKKMQVSLDPTKLNGDDDE